MQPSTSNASLSVGEGQEPQRIHALDILRGATVLSMIAFHACYDAAYLYGQVLPWFTDSIFQDIWRASISWTFLALAGWMCLYSRNNFRRAGIYALSALLVFAATSLASPDTPISFGIMYCMAVSTLIAALTLAALVRIPARVGLVGALGGFALTWALPRHAYDIGGVAWLGLPSAEFVSGDYYPLLPFIFMYLAGIFAAALYQQHLKDRAPVSPRIRKHNGPLARSLALIGKHSLLIYLVHQPVLLALCHVLLS